MKIIIKEVVTKHDIFDTAKELLSKSSYRNTSTIPVTTKPSSNIPPKEEKFDNNEIKETIKSEKFLDWLNNITKIILEYWKTISQTQASSPQHRQRPSVSPRQKVTKRHRQNENLFLEDTDNDKTLEQKLKQFSNDVNITQIGPQNDVSYSILRISLKYAVDDKKEQLIPITFILPYGLITKSNMEKLNKIYDNNLNKIEKNKLAVIKDITLPYSSYSDSNNKIGLIHKGKMELTINNSKKQLKESDILRFKQLANII